MMDEFIKIAISLFCGTALGGVLGYFVRLFIEHRLAIDRIKENIRISEVHREASKFRSTVLYELSGFYPINQHWDKDRFHILYDSIPIINRAAAEFGYFVSNKEDFDKAVSEFNKYCRETTYDSISADIIFNERRKEGELGRREQFANIVETLLSFARVI